MTYQTHWNCKPCRRSITTMYHDHGPAVLSRDCPGCGRPMARVLLEGALDGGDAVDVEVFPSLSHAEESR